MPTSIPKLEEIKQMIFQLPIQEQMMQLAETGFAEWNDPEEDIYDV